MIMFIQKLVIAKFRGFRGAEVQLGRRITAIAGQNGTQKSTILGILSQPFTIPKTSPLAGERPLTGGDYRSDFSGKFRLSPKFDVAYDHEWTVHYSDKEGDKQETYESIHRDKKKRLIRFWKKDDDRKGGSYIELPVIFLSLNRLFPLGEEKNLFSGQSELTEEEVRFSIEWHNKILLLDEEISDISYVSGGSKKTLGVTTGFYDWTQNSSGQDNVGKIILAIISFQRLKNNYPDHYNGGLLVIDEIETTLFPAAQEKLVDFLRRYSSKLNLQIVFTTHSVEVLEYLGDKIEECNNNGDIKIIYLRKFDDQIRVLNNCSIGDIRNHLYVAVGAVGKGKTRIPVFSEDDEARCFLKQILGTAVTKHLQIHDVNIGCKNLSNLVSIGMPGLLEGHCLIVLDGDTSDEGLPKHFIKLPGNGSPEQILANFISGLSDDHEIWDSIGPNYTKQVCFRDYKQYEIVSDREKAKFWFKNQKKIWGRNGGKMIKLWITESEDDVKRFRERFKAAFNKCASQQGLQQLI
jgi:AAA15 family ATPase/GTPase